ncbi:hypothetical protein EXIGLDRAFT_831087 [Exidia glandulosa HHB12029]|uniref:Uncharacterized protein n=1 Tax=Exidia glandulosa HHB12029 TaxID=1314781 RepID=A0A165N051_EXIGL|nr:hypothetical protein EXIGLDRAFT_831087 [Exidia glandulosa HHB12029]
MSTAPSFRTPDRRPSYDNGHRSRTGTPAEDSVDFPVSRTATVTADTWITAQGVTVMSARKPDHDFWPSLSPEGKLRIANYQAPVPVTWNRRYKDYRETLVKLVPVGPPEPSDGRRDAHDEDEGEVDDGGKTASYDESEYGLYRNAELLYSTYHRFAPLPWHCSDADLRRPIDAVMATVFSVDSKPELYFKTECEVPLPAESEDMYCQHELAEGSTSHADSLLSTIADAEGPVVQLIPIPLTAIKPFHHRVVVMDCVTGIKVDASVQNRQQVHLVQTAGLLHRSHIGLTDRVIHGIAIDYKQMSYSKAVWLTNGEQKRATITDYDDTWLLKSFQDWVFFYIFLVNIRRNITENLPTPSSNYAEHNQPNSDPTVRKRRHPDPDRNSEDSPGKRRRTSALVGEESSRATAQADGGTTSSADDSVPTDATPMEATEVVTSARSDTAPTRPLIRAPKPVRAPRLDNLLGPGTLHADGGFARWDQDGAEGSETTSTTRRLSSGHLES